MFATRELTISRRLGVLIRRARAALKGILSGSSVTALLVLGSAYKLPLSIVFVLVRCYTDVSGNGVEAVRGVNVR